MRGKKLSNELFAMVAVVSASLLMTGAPATAQTETVLYNFNSSAQSSTFPIAGLIFDTAGNLYGTASGGGAYGSGTVFELIPKAGGGWTEKNLHNFGVNRVDGYDPYASLIFDAAGNLYGTTHGGGAYTIGTVFELSPSPGGWTEKILYNFNNNGNAGSDAPLTLDAAGNLYGVSLQGGVNTYGFVFELSPTTGAGWTETLLHSFGNGADGQYPVGGLIFDASGNLYGTTSQGGNYNQGTVFELSPKAGGGWTEKVLHHFNPNNTNGSDGSIPYGLLVFDPGGNLFGTTYQGGDFGYGTVFELMPAANGPWTEKILHHFSGPPLDGAFPYAGLIFDGIGNLYGTAVNGGPSKNCGTVFELSPTAGGSWTEMMLHEFNVYSKDGCGPTGGLVFDPSGNLFGTTSVGGTHGYGTVFELAP